MRRIVRFSSRTDPNRRSSWRFARSSIQATRCVVEDPTYTGAISALAALGARAGRRAARRSGAPPRSARAGAGAPPAARALRAAHVPQSDRAGDGRGPAPGGVWRSPRGTAASSSRTTGRATCASRGAIFRRCTRLDGGKHVLYLSTFLEEAPARAARRLGRRARSRSSSASSR